MLELQQQQIADMHANQQCQYEEIQQLTQQGTPAQTISTLIKSEINPPNAARPLKERLGAPAYFDASNLALYPSWRLNMLAKLSVDEDTIGSLTNQSWYINGRLRDHMKQNVDKALTYEAFCIQLQTLNNHLTKLKSIQNSGRRHYTPATHMPAPKNNADTMD
ncbi:hypothetical protein GX50_02901 [[Emmonsia] crescens]|uniref:Uncharacterized protein n=1 Tax=[Emmonsia] crescens TaxID=73230 RepID=A0A2B7ZMB8_9EURO|nr:hypothetical protein GX50_02901 [Emmonsia crescens]